MRTQKRLKFAFTLLSAALLCCGLSLAQTVERPHITGISHASFYTSDAARAQEFYGRLLGLRPGAWSGVYVVGTQSIEAEARPPAKPPDRLSHIAFATDDAEAMYWYLKAHGIAVADQLHVEKNGTRWFALNDPMGNPIEFVQATPARADNKDAVSTRVIHAGFVVRDRAAADAFYRNLLGFRLYWQGAMKDGETDWVDMMVPDGTDWLEYMLVKKDAKPDARLLGILNHAALGVPDIHKAEATLRARGWKPSDQEHAQLGRDGKWQINLYDPDGTRIELMEFAPVEKACCSPYLLAHPNGVQ